MALLPVESSWRMVDGDHDSFDTSVVPNGLASSGEYGDDGGGGGGGGGGDGGEDRVGASLSSPGQDDDDDDAGGSLATSAGTASLNNSQDDDLHAFLRKAENDDRVLLRSPFQPSLPSSVRQTPTSVSSAGRLDRAAASYRTPEPEFRMPTVDLDGSLHADDSRSESLLLHRRVRASDTGSPAQRRRSGGLLGGLHRLRGGGQGRRHKADGPGSDAGRSDRGAVAAWGQALIAGRGVSALLLALVLLGLAAAYAGSPGMAQLRLRFCPPTNAGAAGMGAGVGAGHVHHETRPPAVGLARSAGDLMGLQVQLADVVRRHALSGTPSAPPAQDAWLVPRARTKDLRMAAQRLRCAPLLRELDAYLDAAKRVSMALLRLQNGAAAAAADTLLYSSRSTLAQLRRMAAAQGDEEGGVSSSGGGGGGGWLARRDRLRAVYRHHANALVAKAIGRVDEAKAVLQALQTADAYLASLQSTVTAHRDALVGGGSGGGGDPCPEAYEQSPSGGLVSWLWSLVFDPFALLSPPPSPGKVSHAARAWSGYADELAGLRAAHDAAVGRAVVALDELVAVQGALHTLQAQFGGGGSDSDPAVANSRDLDMHVHVGIVAGGIASLETARREAQRRRD